MRFKPYPKYKPSGVEWLGDVPDGWDVRKLGQTFDIIGSGTTPKSDVEEYYNAADFAWVNTGDLNDGELNCCVRSVSQAAINDHSSLKIYPSGSVIIAMYGATIGKLGILRFPASVNQACCVFVGEKVVKNTFLFYWLFGFREQIVSLATGGGQPNISQETLRTLRFACPQLSEQTQIANFLYRETAKIDTLINKQEKLIELLKEKRQAVISHAVTKGLDPTVPMKESGVEWLGDVPAHWEVSPIKHKITSIEQGWSPQCEGFPAGADEWGVLKVGCVNGGFFRPSENKTFPSDMTPLPALGIARGDLLISRANTRELVGSAAVALDDYPMLMLCDKLYRLRVDSDQCIAQFVSLLLGTSMVRNQIELEAGGASASMLNIAQGTILNLKIALPGLNEQRLIITYLDERTTKINTLIAKAEQAIALQKEHRTALISAAVTGKIDVRAEADELETA